MRQVYLDNAATTRVDPDVLKEMLPFFSEKYGNPNSMHAMGIEARNAVEGARARVSKILGCAPDEIIFTGSGTESDNLAVFGYARKNKARGNHIITTRIEHHAVLDAFKRLESEGFEVTYLDVDIDGLVSLDSLKKALTGRTILVSVIYANNEIGVVQDIPAIAGLCRSRGVAFHTDACQAPNYLDIKVDSIGVDMMSLNGSKMYGPKGVGMLYRRKGIAIEPVLYGGGQEYGLRSGTENVANIVGFASALEGVDRRRAEDSARLQKLRDYLIKELLRIPETRLNGHPSRRLPNNANISFLNIEGESLILLLNEEGIYVSTGSACTSASLEPSHVIVALGLPHELGHSSVRFTLGRETTKDDIDYVLLKLLPLVERLRKISPLNDTMDEILKRGGNDGRH